MSVYALGMGDMKTYSALNEKFKADIELISVEKGSLDTLRVSLAPAEVFSRVGLERSLFLTRLKFTPMRLKNGKAIIRVSSDTPIREPFLDFFIKLDWPNGQMVREYTALLDPPVVTKRSAPKVAVAVKKAGKAPATPVAPSARVQRAQAEGEYGPVQSNETLWEIADSLRTDGISIHQMMMALYKANPDAFLRNNINLLKKGRVLQVPSVDEITGIGRKQAISEFQQQTEAWMNKADQAEAPAPDAGQAREVAEAAVAGDAEAEEVQLKIAGAPAEQIADAEQAVSDLEVEAGSANLKQKMLLLEEEAETARQESVQLHGQMEDLQQQLEDMQRLLSLKDEELARLQEGMSQVDTTDAVAAEEDAGQPGEGIEEVTEAGIVEEEQVDTALQDQPAEEPVEEVAAIEEEVVADAGPVAVEEEPQAATEPVVKAPETPAKLSLVDTALAWVQQNWQLAAAGGGAFFLALLALVFGRRKKETDGTVMPASQTKEQSVDQESILLEEESNLADTVADSMAAGAVGDTSFLSEYSTEEFQGLQEDTAEVDPVSEADVYIAYGRYQQAEEILREAMAAGNDSAAVKYKMLEVYYATQKKDAFASLAEEMVQSGQYEEDPKVWEHIQTMGRDLDKANPLFITGVSAAVAATAAEVADYVGDDSELSLDLSTLAEEVDSALSVDSEPLEGFSELNLDFSSLQTEEDEASDKSDDSIGTDQLASADDQALSETELHTEMLDINDLSDLDVGTTNLDEALADLSGDLEGVMADSQILDEPLDLEDERFSSLSEEITTDSQISGLEDDLEVSVDEDSVIGDEVETKLELAKAFMEIGDADGARGILQEVEEDGTPEQKDLALQMLDQLND
ncbi:FimV/HubP family polar landmark protein [Thiolapillus sp.]